MKLTEVEKQEIIKAADKWYYSIPNRTIQQKEGYIAGAIAMVEKKEVERAKEQQRADWFESEFNRMVQNKKYDDKQLESTQAELESVRTALISETGLYTNLKAELSRLKEVAKEIAYSLEILTERYGHLGASKEVLTKYQTLLEGEKK